MLNISDYEWQEASFDEDHRREGTSHSTVAILKWVYLGEAVMQPCGLDFRAYAGASMLLYLLNPAGWRVTRSREDAR